MTPLLELRDVKTHFAVKRGTLIERSIGTVRAVDGVSLRLAPGEILGLVGESGCGKSTLARTILQLAPIAGGSVLYRGQDLATLDAAALRQLRPKLQMIFQDPYASLNPRMPVYSILAEPLIVHAIVPRARVQRRVAELMEMAGLAPAHMRKYPHEFSGGQRQRIAIARALALEPELVIADEPVSALDVSVQAQILNLISELRQRANLTLIFISHDLAVVRHIADRIAVMYLGKIVEIAESEALFTDPCHPYTRALLEAVPLPDPVRARAKKHTRLEGEPPSPLNPPPGCAFHPRCPYVIDACRTRTPALRPFLPEHPVACIRAQDINEAAYRQSSAGSPEP